MPVGNRTWKFAGRGIAIVARSLLAAGLLAFATCWSTASGSILEYSLQGAYPYYLYGADAGESNQLSVHPSESMWVFSDLAAAITVTGNGPCTQRSPTEVACAPIEHGEPEDKLGVVLGDGNDIADVRIPGRLRVGGGDGNDRLRVIGGDYNFISGDSGDDTITAGPKEAGFLSGSDNIAGGDGNDELRSRNGGDRLSGGDGSDRLIGGRGSDELVGDGGQDVLRGGAGNDRLSGDGLYGPSTGQPDDLSGGRGIDDVVYDARMGVRVGASIRVTLDGRANDGARGERDLVRSDIENISIHRGTASGNERPNTLVVYERGTLIGKAGADILYQGLGLSSRRTLGASQRSRLDGGKGGDRIFTGGSRSAVYGGAGNDTIDTSDGRCREGRPCVGDRIRCGSGRDGVRADQRDIVASDCERITRD